MLRALFSEVFDLQTTEEAKTLLNDDLFRESVPHHNNLKVWKAAPLETDTLKGIADYLITPKHAYIETPLLCVAEAKKDDFVKGAAHRLSQKGNAHKTFISKSSLDDWRRDIRDTSDKRDSLI